MEFFQIIWVIYQLGLFACGLAECLFFGNRFNNGSLFVVVSLLYIFLFASKRNQNFNLASFCFTTSCLVLHTGLDFFSADIPRATIYAAIVLIPVFTCALDKKTTLAFSLMTLISIGVVTCATCFVIILPKWYLDYWKHHLFKRGHFLLPHMLKAYVRQKTALYTFVGVMCAVGLMVLFNLIVKLTRSIKSRNRNSAVMSLKTRNFFGCSLLTQHLSAKMVIIFCYILDRFRATFASLKLRLLANTDS
ncbi:hypothetical protein Ddc_14099 [Ditylenchus destructor]|nr:hypothetical protein Ddc_14099 [Ditylenchus destructor]